MKCVHDKTFIHWNFHDSTSVVAIMQGYNNSHAIASMQYIQYNSLHTQE